MIEKSTSLFGLLGDLDAAQKKIRRNTNIAGNHVHNLLQIVKDDALHLVSKEKLVEMLTEAKEALNEISP